MDPILLHFFALYGNAASGYCLEGDPSNDETLTVTIHLPMAPDRVFICEPASDDDGFYHFRLSNSRPEWDTTVLVPYP